MTYSALDFCKEAQEGTAMVPYQQEQQQKPSAVKKWAKRGAGLAATAGTLALARKAQTGEGIARASLGAKRAKRGGAGFAGQAAEAVKGIGRGIASGHVFKPSAA